MPVLEPRARAPRSSSTPSSRAELAVAEAGALERAQQVGRHAAQADRRAACAPARRSAANCVEEPRVDAGQLVDLLDASSRARARGRPPTSADRSGSPARFCSAPSSSSSSARRPAARWPNSSPLAAELERAERLQEGFLEGAADRHRLAHRLHLRGQRAIGLRELLERPARNLDDDVVDRRLERRRRQPRDVVGDLVEV